MVREVQGGLGLRLTQERGVRVGHELQGYQADQALLWTQGLHQIRFFQDLRGLQGNQGRPLAQADPSILGRQADQAGQGDQNQALPWAQGFQAVREVRLLLADLLLRGYQADRGYQGNL